MVIANVTAGPKKPHYPLLGPHPRLQPCATAGCRR